MKKKLLAVTLILSIVLCTNAFAYRWEFVNNEWYVYDDGSNELVKNSLIDVGNTVYYFDSTGKMVTGWWANSVSKKIYFFDNNPLRNYGAMVFGLHMVDGYFRYFTDDGSLARADKEGEYKKVYLEYWADYSGNLYFNNQLLRDTSTNRSDYYTKPVYYTNLALNNKYLATYDVPGEVPIEVEAVNKPSQSMLRGVDVNADKHKDKVASGGTNYHINENGTVIDDSPQYETSSFEKLGPMESGSPVPNQ